MADISAIKLPDGITHNLVDKTSGYITNYTETDPIFSASAAAGITSANISTWNNKSDFSGNYNDLTNKPTIPTIPTNVSAFVNDAGYLTAHQTIKTINNTSLIGSGNISVQPTLVSGTNIKTINGQSVLGSGNITVSGGSVEEIFFAEYGVTTYQEAEEVYIDGKVIIMKNGPILAQLAQHDEGYEFIFVAYEGEGYYAVYTLDSVEDWNYEGFIIPTSLADLSSDSTHRVVTDTEKATWNGKSNFSGNYNDLSNKPIIPTDKVFIAEKDVTTYAEITAALDAGKTVFAKTSNSFNTFNLYVYAFDNGTSYYFTRHHGSAGAQVNMLVVDNTDTWSSGSTDFKDASNLTSGTLSAERLPVMSKIVSFSSSAVTLNANTGVNTTISITSQSGYDFVGVIGFNCTHNQAATIGAAYKSGTNSAVVAHTNRSTSKWTDQVVTVYALFIVSNAV